MNKKPFYAKFIKKLDDKETINVISLIEMSKYQTNKVEQIYFYKNISKIIDLSKIEKGNNEL